MPTELLTEAVQLRRGVFCNIVGIRDSQNLYDDLTDNPEDYALAQEVEGQKKPILTGSGIIDRPFDYGVIDFPFDTSNWSQTRFSDGRFGVFYGSLELETTIYETVYHTLQDLDAANFLAQGASIIRERRVCLVEVDAILYDCREKVDEFQDLIHPHDYTYTNDVGRYIHSNDRDGLITKSARCEGVNTPIFRRDRLDRPRDHCFLSYSVDTEDEIVFVERTRGQVDYEIPWSEFDLLGPLGN